MQRTNVAKWYEKYHRWQIKVQKDNERRTFTSSTPGRKGQRECHAKADAWLDDGITDARVKVATLYEEYYEEVKNTTSQSNWRGIQSYFNTWILPAIGHKRMDALVEQDFQNIINKAYGAGLSKKTLQNIRGTMMTFLKYARKKRVTTLFPESLTIPKNAYSKERNILQPDDLKTLFSSDLTMFQGKVQHDRMIHAYRFQVLTGIRPGELLGLHWDDVVEDTVYIKRSKNVHNEITQGKNKNAKRRFVLSEMAKKVLADQKLLKSTGTVFDELTEKSYYGFWCRYCKYHGIPHTSLYELRHTFVSIAKTLPEGQIKSIVGHSANMDTFGVYGHELTGELEKTAKDLDKIFLEMIP